LCAVVFTHLATFSYLTCKKEKSDQVSDCKMGDLIASIKETIAVNPTHISRCPSSSGFEDEGHLLTFMYMRCFGVVRVQQKWGFLVIFSLVEYLAIFLKRV
jgi:hypothetical protein